MSDSITIFIYALTMWKRAKKIERFKGGITITSDEKIIAALLSTDSVTEAAKACKISKTTVYARLKDPAFSEMYYQARLELLKAHVARLHGHLGSAIETIAQVMKNTESPAQTRLNAAEAIIRNCMKLTEQTDILTRLKALEARSGAKQ